MRLTTNPYHQSLCLNNSLLDCYYCKHEFSVSNELVLTSTLRTGTIMVAYIGLPKNSDGKLLIPDDEEYYTLDLKRNFDGDEDDEDELAGFDVSNVDPHNLDQIDEPPKSSSMYDDATLVHADPDYRPRSSNQGGFVKERHILDQDTTSSDRVGDPGHWGVDEDTG